MFEASRGKQLFDVQVHGAEIRAIAVDPKRRWIATGDKDGVVMLWNFKCGEEAATLNSKPQGPVAGLAIVDKGKRLIGSSGGKQVLIWDLTGLQHLTGQWQMRREKAAAPVVLVFLSQCFDFDGIQERVWGGPVKNG